MRRGDIVIIAQRGAYEGKPRPAVIIQAEELLTHPSVLVCLLTSASEGARGAFYRIAVEPSRTNGLREKSIIQVDKIVTARRENISQIVGHLDEATIGRLNVALALFQGLA